MPLIAHVVTADGSPDAVRVGRHTGYFSDVGASVCDWLGVKAPGSVPGVSFVDGAEVSA